MSVTAIIELAVAAALIAGSVLLYRRRAPAADGSAYGSQSAVLMLIVGAIMAIHALGLLEYRPSQSELEIIRDRAR